MEKNDRFCINIVIKKTGGSRVFGSGILLGGKNEFEASHHFKFYCDFCFC